MTEPTDGPTGHNRDDELRALFEDAVSDVDPPPALHHIQARTHDQSKVTPMNNKRPWIIAAIGAVAATAATLVAVTVITDEDPRETAGPASSPSASATPDESTEPSDEATAEPTDEPAPSKPPAGETAAVPVYYVGETPAGTRLFREFHRVTTDDPVLTAVKEAISGSPLDPDYRTPWAGTGAAVGSVSFDGVGADGIIQVDLGSGVPLQRPAGMSAEEATMAVQQVVYTAQAALQARAPVEFYVEDRDVETLLGVPVAEQAVAGDPMEVQAPVWIIDPQNGDTVGRTFTVHGRGAFFEANVSWQLLRGVEVVKEGFATAEEGMTLSPYSFEVTAEPGDYELRVYDADMSGGEGNGEAQDTKLITVK